MTTTQLLIGGQWTAARSGETEEVRSPFDGSVVGEVPTGRPGGRRAALAGGRARRGDLAAHPGARADADPAAGGRAGRRARRGDRADASARRPARRSPRRRGEAARSGELIRLAAFEGTQLYGDSLPLDANRGTGFDKIGFTVRQPVGVVVAITPFNYPSLLVLHKLAPALAAGQRGRPQAGPHHPVDRAGAGRVLRRRRAARGRAVGADRPRRRARRRAGQRPAGATRSRSPGRPASASASRQLAGVKKLSLELGASCPVVVLPDADIDAGRERCRARRLRQRRPGVHLGAAGDHPPGDRRRLPGRPGAEGGGDPAPATRRPPTPTMGTLITDGGGASGSSESIRAAVAGRRRAADRRRAGRRDRSPRPWSPASTRRRRSARTSCSARPSR